MIIVVIKFDVFIKLVFENNKSVSMFGFGDIVVFGMFMGFVFCFDFY